MHSNALVAGDHYRSIWALAYAALVSAIAILIAIVPLTFDDTEAVTPYAGQVWVPVTQQTVSGPFVRAWLGIYETDRLGMPVSGAVQQGDRWVQWFEYGRLELTGVPIEAATPEQVQLTPIGRSVAEKIGYVTHLPEFRPLAGPPADERFFSETGHTLRLGFLKHYERDGVAGRLGFPISEEFSFGGVVYQYFEYGALSWEPGIDVQEVKLGSLDASLNVGLGLAQARPEGAIAYDSDDMLALSDAFPGERWIDIDLSDFTLTAYVGDQPLLESTIVTGHVNSPTPTGTFSVWLMYEQQDMSGIGWSGAPYFEAGVPWVIYFYQDYAIHGSTWRTGYGVQDSQGCVIQPNEIAEMLYWWADHGMTVVVHE